MEDEDSLRERLLSTGQASASGQQEADGSCPLEKAGLWSKLTFNYVTPLILAGYKKPLQNEDMWMLPKNFEAGAIFEELSSRLQATKDPVKRPQGSVAWAIVRTYWRRAALAAILLTSDTIMTLLEPLLLQRLLTAVRNSRPKGEIIGFALATFAAQLAVTIVGTHFWWHSLQIAARVRAALRMLLFRKALRLSVAARTTNGVGAIVNLAANDADRIADMSWGFNMLWIAPLQIILTLLVLVRILGWIAVGSGMLVILLAIPLASLITFIFSKVRVKLLECTDSRVKLISEVVQGLKAIKLYAWEQPFTARIEALRNQELFFIKTSALLEAANAVIFWGVPLLVQAATFTAFALLSGRLLTPELAFPALALLNQLSMPLFFLPDQIGAFVQGRVSIKRIQAFLNEPEMEQLPCLPAAAKGEAALTCQHGEYCWEPGKPATLTNINFELQEGKLMIVVGPVGAGKSSLLAALLGEMSGTKTAASVAGSIAYTAQEPWIQNMTVRDNILMGATFDEKRYNATLQACALSQDLAMLPAGDRTEIGEKGINLSGGQKHRIALARACYQGSDVYFLDDPLSAVDVHVGQHLMTACICGLLAEKTRIVVTHQLQFLPFADTVMVINDGHIDELGTYQELLDRGVEFKQFGLPSSSDSDDSEEPSDGDALSARQHSQVYSDSDALYAPRYSATFSDASAMSHAPSQACADGAPPVGSYTDGQAIPLPGGQQPSPARAAHRRSLSRSKSKRASIERRPGASVAPPPAADSEAEEEGRLVEEEERAIGQVDRKLYLQYFTSWGPFLILPSLLIAVQLGNQALVVVQNWWLSQWANKGGEVQHAGGLDTQYYLKIYIALGMAGVVAQGSFAFIMAIGSVRASRKLHHNLLRGLLRLPMSFFDSQPTGRLMNRFTKDTQAVDLTLFQVMQDVIDCLGATLAGLTITSIVAPVVVVVLAPVAWAFDAIRRRFIATSREIKRLDSLALSPILSTFSETLQGLLTVRAHRVQGAHVAKQEGLLSRSVQIYLPMISTNRWLAIRIEGMGAFIVLLVSVACTIVLPRSAGLVGLAIANTLDLAMMANWVVRQLSETEVAMNSVERMVGYIKEYEPEAPAVVESHRPPSSWPSEGDISVQKLVVRYRSDLPEVLKGLTFHVHARHKVGIAGRTGCGKSTLMMSLFRVMEPSAGSIIIDGVDICSIGLFDLRSRLALVPQDPVIFSGSIRSNLDPFGSVKNDARIWEALDRAGIKPAIAAMEGGLDADMTEGGGTLSTGQRQLLCMARALLRAAKVLVLDEATSNVDTASDALIQETVRLAFAECTVLTVAHRLHTIMDSDRVLVLDAGRVKEFAAPRRLLQDSSSAFSALVADTEQRAGDTNEQGADQS